MRLLPVALQAQFTSLKHEVLDVARDGFTMALASTCSRIGVPLGPAGLTNLFVKKPRPMELAPVGAGVLSNRFQKAFAYAFMLHQKQMRHGSQIPYISHPMAVAYVALEYGADENEAMAALLHDTAEDQGGEKVLREILRRFGPEVEGIVRGLTVSETLPFDTSSMNRFEKWQAKKLRYLETLKIAPLPVKLIKASDLLCNLRSILKGYLLAGEAMWEATFTSAGARIIEWYYPAVIAALKTGDFQYKGLPELIQELEKTVREIRAARQ